MTIALVTANSALLKATKRTPEHSTASCRMLKLKLRLRKYSDAFSAQTC